MAMVIPPNMYLAKIRWRLEGDREEMISTIGVNPTELPNRTLEQIAEGVYGAWAGAWEADTLATMWQLVGVTVVGTSTAEGSPTGSYDEVTQGTNSSAPLPQNCAILVKKKTALGGQRHAGRMYLPSGYTSEADVSPTGVISNANVTNYQNRMNQFWTNIQDESGPPDILSGATALQPMLFHSVGAVDGTPITHFSVDPIIATQRQRLRR